MDTAGLRRFLQRTFDLWDVSAAVEADLAEDRLRVQAADGSLACIEHAPSDSPFRWFLRYGGGAAESGDMRSRPCGSLVGVLTALRRAFGVERGSAIRIAPQSDKGSDPLVVPEASKKGPDPFSHGRVPVRVLTGFLGSGKTTLLARLLRHPDMGRTAVIVNEFGEVPLDHDLIETSDESFVQLSTGCLCCRVRSDLVLTLTDLAARRRSGTLPAFERVVIETSGLADPGPILHAIMTDRGLAEAYGLDGVVTTMDGIAGADTLARYPESARQAAVADVLVITKTDLPYARADVLMAQLRRLNPDARIVLAVRGEIEPTVLFASAFGSPSMPGPLPQRERILLPSPPGRTAAGEGRYVQSRATPPSGHHHSEGITSHCLVRESALHAATLALFVSALADNCGKDLLRLKGIVRIAEEPERPAVVHGVQHVYYPLEWLPRWPSADERTRIVFIGHGLEPEWIEALLQLLEAEVIETMASRGPRMVEGAATASR